MLGWTSSPGATVLQGMLKGEDLSAAYASADVFVMPSESETLGFVAMEVCPKSDLRSHLLSTV